MDDRGPHKCTFNCLILPLISRPLVRNIFFSFTQHNKEQVKVVIKSKCFDDIGNVRTGSGTYVTSLLFDSLGDATSAFRSQ